MPGPDLLSALKEALASDQPASRTPAPGPSRVVVVLGVGAELRSDDAAGVRVAQFLMRHPVPGARAIDAGTVPESCTAEIRRLSPSDVIIVDCARMGARPGTVRVIDPSDVGSASFGTHGLPLTVIADYLRVEIRCKVTIIGIEPASIEFGERLSPEVAAAVDETVRTLQVCLAQSPPPPPDS